MALAGVATWGYYLMLEARNEIAKLTRVQILIVPTVMSIAFVGCKYLHWPPWTVSMLMCFSTMFVSFVVRPWIASRIMSVSYSSAIKNSILPNAFGFAPAFALASMVHFGMSEGTPRVLAVLGTFVLAVVPATWYFTLDLSERHAFSDIFSRAVNKVWPARGGGQQ